MPIANGSMQGQPWGHETDMLNASPNVHFQRQHDIPKPGASRISGYTPWITRRRDPVGCYRRDAATWSDWLRQPASWLLLLRIRLRFEYGAAIVGELRRVLPQTRHDAVYIRNLITAHSPHIGRAGDLLFPGSAILLGKCNILQGANASDREGKAEHNTLRGHVRSFHLSAVGLVCRFHAPARHDTAQ